MQATFKFNTNKDSDASGPLYINGPLLWKTVAKGENLGQANNGLLLSNGVSVGPTTFTDDLIETYGLKYHDATIVGTEHKAATVLLLPWFIESQLQETAQINVAPAQFVMVCVLAEDGSSIQDIVVLDSDKELTIQDKTVLTEASSTSASVDITQGDDGVWAVDLSNIQIKSAVKNIGNLMWLPKMKDKKKIVVQSVNNELIVDGLLPIWAVALIVVGVLIALIVIFILVSKLGGRAAAATKAGPAALPPPQQAST